MDTDHLVVIGNCRKMKELPSDSVHLIITSPPGLNKTSNGAGDIDYLNAFCGQMKELRKVFDECYRVLQGGRLICINFHHFLNPSQKEPVPAHIMHALQLAGFEFQLDVVWTKPALHGSGGQTHLVPQLDRIYPPLDEGIFERTLIFSKGTPGTGLHIRKHKRSMGLKAAMKWWNTATWDVFTDNSNPYSGLAGSSRFSPELVQMLISDFSFEGETVLDPFLGSGAISKVAAQLHRRSVGYESNPHSVRIIRQVTGITDDHLKVVFQREGRLT